jgi:alpha-tubulin suppressor-like RCC1 family protein
MYDEDIGEYDNVVAVPVRLERWSSPLIVKHVACGGMHTLAVLSNG